MAIYKNREVSIIGPNVQASTPTTITIRYVDGTHENVSLGLVKFTEDEKKWLLKNYPSRYDDVPTIKDDDVKAVRIGVAPSFDQSAKDAAETEAQRQKQLQLAAEQNKKLQDEASKNVDKKVNAPVTAPTTPQYGKVA